MTDLRSFYKAVLPLEGPYALFLLGEKRHVWADTIEGLARETELRKEQLGVYFATASFKAPTARTQANVQALRAFRLDIDAGTEKFQRAPDNAYETKREALAALVGFAKAASLPPSFVVSSGLGLHAYFALDEDVSPERWGPFANRLSVVAAEHGLRVDPTVTRDTARVLRPIGSLHSAGVPVSMIHASGKVYTLEEFAKQVRGIAPEALEVLEKQMAGPKYDMSVNDDTKTYIETPKSIRNILPECPALQEIARAKGNVQEPQWRAMLGLVKHTVEGDMVAHHWSSGHPSYDRGETQAKYDAYEAGPTTCATFGLYTKACGKCKHNGKIKSPITLGKMTAAQEQELPPEKRTEAVAEAALAATAVKGKPWDGALPKHYTVQLTPHGYELHHSNSFFEKDKLTGNVVQINEIVPITRDIFWLGRWVGAESTEDRAQVEVYVYHAAKKEVVKYSMGIGETHSQADLNKWLATKAVVIGGHKKAKASMESYVKGSLERIKQMAGQPKIATRFGLRIESNGDMVCAQGKYVIDKTGTIQEGVLSGPLIGSAKQFSIPLPPNALGVWDPSVWTNFVMPLATRYAEFMRGAYGTPGLEPYQLVAMLGLASPFMAFVQGSYTAGIELPPTGLSVSLYSQNSGRGKTALMKAIMLAFGDHDQLVADMNTNGATDIGRMSKISVAGTFPTSMDEMGSVKETSIASMISSVANGSGRTRGTKDGGFTTGSSWALINLITTNRAQRDMVASTQKESEAIQARLLELNVGGVEFSPEQMASFGASWAAIQDTQGALGAVINYQACKMGPVAVNKMVTMCVQEAATLLAADQAARFQFRALGALLFLQKLLTREGLAMFDTKVLVDEFRKAHDAGVEFVKDNILPTSGVDLLGMMLASMKPNMLVTKHDSKRGSPTIDLILNTRVPGEVVARHVQSLGYTLVSFTAMKKWCADNKVSFDSMFLEVKNAGLIEKRGAGRWYNMVDLFRGTAEQGATSELCVKIDVRRLSSITGGTYDVDDTVDNVIEFKPRNEAPVETSAPTPKEAT